MKKCSCCKHEKPFDLFVKDKYNKDGVSYDCKSCRYKKANARIKNKKEYYKSRNEKHRETRKKYYSIKENILKAKNTTLIKTFNITLDDYNKMLEHQNNCCAVCLGEQKSNRNKFFCVDHCHITGIVRGLLCDSCNRGIGLLKDDVEILHRAKEYIKNAKKYQPASSY